MKLDLKSISEQFSDPEAARSFLESQRWPDGPIPAELRTANVP